MPQGQGDKSPTNKTFVCFLLQLLHTNRIKIVIIIKKKKLTKPKDLYSENDSWKTEFSETIFCLNIIIYQNRPNDFLFIVFLIYSDPNLYHGAWHLSLLSTELNHRSLEVKENGGSCGFTGVNRAVNASLSAEPWCMLCVSTCHAVEAVCPK